MATSPEQLCIRYLDDGTIHSVIDRGCNNMLGWAKAGKTKGLKVPPDKIQEFLTSPPISNDTKRQIVDELIKLLGGL